MGEREGEQEARMTRKPAAVHGEEAGVPSDFGSHDCHCCSEKDGGCVIMSKVKGLTNGLACKVTGCGLKRQIINQNSR